MFRRAFVQAGDLRLHYRTAGSGPPVVMLHPSPLSSQAVLPVAASIARSRQVYALDTPGYGLSDPLPARPRSLDEFLPALEAFLDAAGIATCCLYGAATGAQIALEFAASHPDRVTLLVMDTAGHIPPAECDRLVAGYFPDVTPRADGAHLLTLWGLVRDLGVFFPWNDTRSEARIPRDLPPASFMQAMLLDYFRAGTGYDWAYRPAFYNERVERVRRCRVPAILTRWPSSIALSITDALIAEGLPENFRVLDLGTSMEDRADGIAAAISEAGPGTRARPAMPAATDSLQLASHLLDAGDQQLHARMSVSGAGRPLVALHRAGASARLLEPGLVPLRGSRPIIAIDLPGHGDSDLPGAGAGAPATSIELALGAAGVDEADLLGDGLGAEVAMDLAATRPSRFPRVAAIARFHPGSANAPWPSLTPNLDGSHLLQAWFMLRDRRLWFPWHCHQVTAIRQGAPDLDANSLHVSLVELFKCGERFGDAARHEAAANLAARVDSRRPEVLLLAETTGGLVSRGPDYAPPMPGEAAGIATLVNWLEQPTGERQ